MKAPKPPAGVESSSSDASGSVDTQRKGSSASAGAEAADRAVASRPARKVEVRLTIRSFR